VLTEKPPINSVYDLALLITSRCCGVFDRHKLDNENFQFLDMFESSIGKVVSSGSLFSLHRLLTELDKSRDKIIL
jgi:hypothetical protein